MEDFCFKMLEAKQKIIIFAQLIQELCVVEIQCVRDKRKCVLYAYNASATKENAFCTPTMRPRQKKMRFVRLQCVRDKRKSVLYAYNALFPK